MEKFNSQEYRDELANELREIRNDDEEDVITTREDAKDFLKSQQKTKEYKSAKAEHEKQVSNKNEWNSVLAKSPSILSRVSEIINKKELYKNNPDKVDEFLKILLLESEKVGKTMLEIESLLKNLDSLLPDPKKGKDVTPPKEKLEFLLYLLDNITEKYTQQFGYENEASSEFVGIGSFKKTLRALLKDVYGYFDKGDDFAVNLGLFINAVNISLDKPIKDDDTIINEMHYSHIREAGDECYEVMDFLYKKGGADIFYFAPRSATFPAKTVKYFIDFIADRNPKIKRPYFAFPTSKVFKRIDYSYFRETISDYLKDPSPDSRDNFLKRLGNISGKENFVDTIDNLKKIFELKSKQSKDINIIIFDEAMNHGNTIDSLKELVKAVAYFFEKEKGVKVSIDKAPIVYGDAYWPRTSPLKGTREDYSAKISRHSGEKDSITYTNIKLADETTKLYGEMVGLFYFAKEKAKEIFD